MWLLRLWSVFYVIFGCFPFYLRLDQGIVVADVAVLSFMFSLILLYLCYGSVVDICVLYEIPGSEPQLYGCYTVCATTAGLIINRAILFLQTKRLLSTILKQVQYTKRLRYFRVSTYLIAFAALVSLIKLTFLLIAQQDLIHIEMVVWIVSSYLIMGVNKLIQSQFVLICSFLQIGFSKIDDSLETPTVLGGPGLREARGKVGILSSWFDWSLSVFKVDLLFSTNIVLIAVLLSMNDLTVTYFNAKDTGLELKNFGLYISYFLISDAEEMVFFVWLIVSAMRISKTVCSISTCLYKQNTTVMDQRAKDEMILMLEQVSHCRLDLNICGFFTISPRFLFTMFSTVLTLFVLFVQLFQLRQN